MPLFNAITGLKRKMPAYRLPRKKRCSHSSTVASRMYAKRAMDDFEIYLAASSQQLMFFFTLHNEPNANAVVLATWCFLMSAYVFSKAARMLLLDSELMDMPADDNQDEHGYHKPLVGITLDSYANDDECFDKTRFRKDELRLVLEHSGLPETTRLYYYQQKCYKFRTEELLLHMLRKQTSGRTHKDMTDEFGGCSSRWGRGHNWFVTHLDRQFFHLIGPEEGIRIWADQFPYFAEQIRQCVVRDKKRTRSNGTEYYLGLAGHDIEPGTFNVMSFVDCTHYEHCRPGAGPVNDEEASPRRPGWYPKQRAFYTAYQRGQEACVKILTLCLPNGMTACVYGPTSGRRNDLTLFRMSDLDDVLMDLCVEHHGGDLCCTCGDGIFAGQWHCLRTKHYAPPGMQLTEAQEVENDNVASARISVEWSYARAEMLFPTLNIKNRFKIEIDAVRSFAEIRVMYLFTNFRVCTGEGSTMTGERAFQCPPPTLEEYMTMGNNP